MQNDLIGEVFGRLKVIREDDKRKGKRYWICKCECGKTVSVVTSNLKNGSAKSCGCLRQENFIKMLTSHGLSKTKIYKTWKSMKFRCYNENDKEYDRYGGRGIEICDEWLNKENGFINFYEWAMANNYNDKLTIDRIDNDGDYCPENCRWATLYEQGNNKSNNVFVNYEGEEITLKELSVKLGTTFSAIKNHYYRGNLISFYKLDGVLKYNRNKKADKNSK